MDLRTIYDPAAKMTVTEFSVLASSPVPAKKSWLWTTSGGTRGLEGFRNGEGAAPLSEMVTRLILRNLTSLTPEHFANVPWVFAERLWRMIQANDLVSVGIWTAFVKAYYQDLLTHPNPQQISGLLYCGNNARLPSTAKYPSFQGRALLSNLPHITALNLEWITVLTLFDLPMSRHDWVTLHKLKNIGSLYVHNSGHQTTGSLDDIVLRLWAEAARMEQAFPVLQLVMLVNQNQLTFGVLEDLASFPRLRAVLLTGPLLTKDFNISDDILSGTRWKYFKESLLCLKLFRMWSGARDTSYGKRAQELLKCLQNEEHKLLGTEKKVYPLMNVISGNDPTMQMTHRTAPMWFELLPLDAPDQKGKRALQDTETFTAKKSKARINPKISMAEMMQGFGSK